MYKRTSVVANEIATGKRDVKSAPFVELLGGRVQGVISSGSDIERVYVSFVESGTGDYYCCTNNNRPCGGLRGSGCKHIAELVDEAIAQFGVERVATYLGLGGDPSAYENGWAVLSALRGSEKKESPGVVFSRFLNYLRYCELASESGSVIEMSWFVS